jgi:hypothetical protein
MVLNAHFSHDPDMPSLLAYSCDRRRERIRRWGSQRRRTEVVGYEGEDVPDVLNVPHAKKHPARGLTCPSIWRTTFLPFLHLPKADRLPHTLNYP